MQVRQNGKTSIFYRKEKEKKVSRHERQITAVRNFYLILFQGRKKKAKAFCPANLPRPASREA